jgi:predicted transcriptional regulator
MRSASVQRIENIRRLVAALAQRSMEAREVAELLNVSDRAARNYLKELEEAGAADHALGCRTRLRLRSDPAVLERYLSTLTQRIGQQHVALRRSVSRHCLTPGTKFLHVLADDVRFPLVMDQHPPRRDPLVAALFGTTIGLSDHK